MKLLSLARSIVCAPAARQKASTPARRRYRISTIFSRRLWGFAGFIKRLNPPRRRPAHNRRKLVLRRPQDRFRAAEFFQHLHHRLSAAPFDRVELARELARVPARAVEGHREPMRLVAD